MEKLTVETKLLAESMVHAISAFESLLNSCGTVLPSSALVLVYDDLKLAKDAIAELYKDEIAAVTMEEGDAKGPSDAIAAASDAANKSDPDHVS